MSNDNQLWTDAKPDEYHKRIWPYLKHLEGIQAYRREQNELFFALYGDREARGLGNRLLLRPTRDGAYKLSYNVIKAVCDTAQSKIAQHKNLPFLLTEDGDWIQQHKGKQLNRFNEGVFYLTNFFSLAQEQFLDAVISGTGFLYFFDAEPERDLPGRIACERVFTDEIKVDDALSIYGEPPEMHRIKLVSRRAYADRYKRSREKHRLIMSVPAAKIGRAARSPHADEMIEVAVTWRKASREGANDGLEVHTIENCTLEVGKWTHDWFPVVPFRWNKQPRGYFGRGIASLLLGHQYEINTVLRVISKSLRLMAAPRLIVPTGSNINPALLTDEIGSVIPAAPGLEPKILAQQILPPETYQWFETQKRDAFEQAGINELSATGRKPSGLDAAVALQTYTDMQNERFAMVEQRWEDNSIEAAKRINALARDIAKEKGDYRISAVSSDGFERMSWKKDIDLAQDDVVYKAWPQNLFSKTPTAKLQQARDLYNDGILDRNQFMRVVDYPDLKAIMNLANASTESVFRAVALIMEKGQYKAPEGFQNLKEAVPIVHGLLLKYEASNAPPDRLDKLRTWLAQAFDIVKKSAPPPAVPTDGAPAAAPPAAPAAPMEAPAPIAA